MTGHLILSFLAIVVLLIIAVEILRYFRNLRADISAIRRILEQDRDALTEDS